MLLFATPACTLCPLQGLLSTFEIRVCTTNLSVDGAAGAEELFAVGRKRDVFGEPEDGQHHGLYATGVGGDVVLLENEVERAAGAVDKEVLRHGDTSGNAVLVEEAVAGVLVHI